MEIMCIFLLVQHQNMHLQGLCKLLKVLQPRTFLRNTPILENNYGVDIFRVMMDI